MATFEIPLSPSPQFFNIELAGVTYKVELSWNNFANSWQLNFYDTNGNRILCGVPLVTGQDLLQQYSYLNFGGELLCMTDGDPGAIPTFDNIGSTSHVLFKTP